MLKEVEALDDFWKDVTGDELVSACKFPFLQALDGIDDGERVDLVDGISVNDNMARILPQPATVAVRADDAGTRINRAQVLVYFSFKFGVILVGLASATESCGHRAVSPASGAPASVGVEGEVVRVGLFKRPASDRRDAGRAEAEDF